MRRRTLGAEGQAGTQVLRGKETFMGLCHVAGQTHSRRGKVPVGQGANHTRQSVLPILGFSPNPSPRSGGGHLTKASRCHTGKVSKYTPGRATRQEPFGLPSTERMVPPSPDTPAECTFLCAWVGERSRNRGRGSQARGSCERNKQALVTDKTPQLPEWSPPGAGSPALRVWGPGSLSFLLHLVPTWSMR